MKILFATLLLTSCSVFKTSKYTLTCPSYKYEANTWKLFEIGDDTQKCQPIPK